MPKIGDEEILLKVDICGVCGTDVCFRRDSVVAADILGSHP